MKSMRTPEASPRLPLGITLGDINGIGPEILARALTHDAVRRLAPLLVFGDADVLEAMRPHAPDMPRCCKMHALDEPLPEGDGIAVYDAGQTAPALRPGVLDPAAGRCAAAWIEAAAAACLSGRLRGMVTCPVNKEGMLQSGCPYPGHTPMLAALSGVTACHMSLFSRRMRIVHVTAHLALREAVAQLTQERVIRAIEAGAHVLDRLGLAGPRIAVAGLNPHAGEGGAFGHEEQTVIAPAVAEANARGLPCEGPFAPDTVFQRMYAGEFDLVAAMYHDQGHIPFKLVARDDGVHATLGLPFIRTSPDHGTAYDIAGKGIAREHSLCAALELAAQWALGEDEPGREQP